MSWLSSLTGSKKTSEAGVWIADEDVSNCYCCGVGFSLMIRKHHCRQCGQVVCSGCSENRKFLESSRSGAPKRICDKCHKGEIPEGDDEDEDGGDAGVKAVTKGVAGASVSDGGATGGAGATAGAGTGDSSSRRPAPGMPPIPVEDSLKGLKLHAFDGTWEATLNFQSVESSKAAAPEAIATGSSLGAFKKVDVSKSRRGTLAAPEVAKAGSKIKVLLALDAKGAAYFGGTCADLAQFGRDGKVKGAVQRSNGKVNMTVTLMNNKVTTTFTFTGLMDATGALLGTFSGCEISKAASAASGTFRMVRIGDGDDEEGGAAGAAAGGGSGSDDDDAPMKKASKGSASKSSRKVVDSDDDDDDGGSKPAAKGSSKAKSSRKVASDSEEEEPAPKKKAAASKCKVVDSDDEEDDPKPKKAAAKARVATDSDDSDARPAKKAVTKSKSKKAVASDSDE